MSASTSVKPVSPALASPSFVPVRSLVAVSALAVLLVACGGKDQPQGGGAGAGGAPGGSAPPPAEVGVVTVTTQKVALQTELPGRVEALRVAQVRARANGVVEKRLFQEGSEVKAGQVLYRIDPAPYKAQLDSAQAAVVRAEANLSQAAAQAERYKPLVEANAVSKQDYLNVVAAQKTAVADVNAAKAAVQTARINLDYATVTAPISGRIGRALVTEGALVSATEATQLALIQQLDKVYVNFTQPSSDVYRLRKSLAAGQLKRTSDGSMPVRIVLEDGTELAQAGKLLFSDVTVDSTTGQITLRAEVPNGNGVLLPGQYVRVRLSQAELPSGILLPQQAVTRSNQGDTVLVVGEDGKPAKRTITLGAPQGTDWLVLSGVKPGEKVIVEGFQKMMVPGAPVKPVPWKKLAASAAAASGPASAAAPAASAASAQ